MIKSNKQIMITTNKSIVIIKMFARTHFNKPCIVKEESIGNVTTGKLSFSLAVLFNAKAASVVSTNICLFDFVVVVRLIY